MAVSYFFRGGQYNGKNVQEWNQYPSKLVAPNTTAAHQRSVDFALRRRIASDDHGYIAGISAQDDMFLRTNVTAVGDTLWMLVVPPRSKVDMLAVENVSPTPGFTFKLKAAFADADDLTANQSAAVLVNEAVVGGGSAVASVAASAVTSAAASLGVGQKYVPAGRALLVGIEVVALPTNGIGSIADLSVVAYGDHFLSNRV